ncbi:hypothetical protein OKA05_15355 [Luteolibacter arcticus]|uniref:DUF7035 domain-containing protein n=1 Tax=Luteolibacter arcticus TaxID=1581411 RepID=A0ABT3GKA3_9BACT|nr:hypothetical protein [Luteolibacter arcticus]MCW1923943.1 hypothetical protein [Luteolibacter arcticus]
MKAFAFLLAAACLSACPLLADDTAHPVVTSISITPETVDVTSGPGSVSITAHITDDDSGFSFGNFILINGNGNHIKSFYFNGEDTRLPDGDALDGTYQLTINEVPQYGEPGDWRVDVLVFDHSGNARTFGQHPDDIPLPVPDDGEFTVVNTGEVDSAAPEIGSAEINPDPFSTASEAAELTLTIHGVDTLSGIDRGFLWVYKPNGDEFANSLSFGPADLLPGGTVNDGIYQLPVELPQGSDYGDWEVQVLLIDRTGNAAFRSGIHFSNVAEITHDVGFLAQALDAVHLPWTTSGSRWIFQTEENWDDRDAAASKPIGHGEECVMQTTVTGPGTLSFMWRVDSEESADILSVELVGGDTHQISGDLGWELVELAIPEGEQTMIWRYTKDGSGSIGADRGYVDHVTFRSDTDTALPQVQDIYPSVRKVDVSGGEQLVEYTIEITDDLTGFESGRIELYNPNGDGQVSTTFDGGSRIRGDEFSGTYAVSLPFSPTPDLGLWHVRVETMEYSNLTPRIYGPGGERFPVTGSNAVMVIDGPLEDVTAPQIRALEIDPSVIDVSDGPATALVTLRITDYNSGFNFANLDLFNPTAQWTGSHYFTSYQLLQGDQFDGIYQVEVVIPQYAEGTWRIGAGLADQDNNERHHENGEGLDNSIDERLTVINTGPVDHTSPVVTSIEITPDTIDVSGGPQDIQITVSIDDDVSGRRDAILFFYDPADVFHGAFTVTLDEDNRIDQDGLSETFEDTVTIPLGTTPGDWTVRLFLRDKVGKTNFYGWENSPYPEPGDGIFTISGEAPSLFEAFVSTHSLTGDDALPGADPDGDGQNNATELMLGTDPNDNADAGAGAFTLSRDATHLHYDFTIDPALTVAVDGLYLALTDAGGGAPLRLTGQSQAGLVGPWADVLPVLQSGSTWRVSIPFAGGSKGFLRLFFEDP